VGINVNYSGTVAAAKEAAMAGIPAMAVSIISPRRQAYRCRRPVCRIAFTSGNRPAAAGGTFLNVNFPDLPMEQVRGVRWSRQGFSSVFAQHFEKRRDPRDRIYYWQGCDSQAAYDQADIDGAALDARYISITPIKCDMTDYDALRELARWDIPPIP
jgi:5'-nucleotidase